MDAFQTVKSLRSDLSERLGLPDKDMIFKARRSNDVDFITTYPSKNPSSKVTFIVDPTLSHYVIKEGKTVSRLSYRDLLDTLVKTYNS